VGGVDLADQKRSHYEITLQVKKWTNHVFLWNIVFLWIIFAFCGKTLNPKI
jgi:hypothetical protein